MKRCASVFPVLLSCVIFACDKDFSGSYSSILGTWRLKNDSLVSGVGFILQKQNYVGQAGDHFDFRINDTLYIREGARKDTVHFSLLNDNKIVIEHVGITINGVASDCEILDLTAHTVTIHASPSTNPGAYYERWIYLFR